MAPGSAVALHVRQGEAAVFTPIHRVGVRHVLGSEAPGGVFPTTRRSRASLPAGHMRPPDLPGAAEPWPLRAGSSGPGWTGAGSVALRVSISPDPSHPSAPEDWPSDEFSCPWGLQERTRRKRNPGPAPCLPRAHHPAPSRPGCASFKECLSGAAQGTVHLPGAPEGKARRKAEVGRWQVRPDSNSPLALDPARRLEPARRAGGGGRPQR